MGFEDWDPDRGKFFGELANFSNKRPTLKSNSKNFQLHAILS